MEELLKIHNTLVEYVEQYMTQDISKINTCELGEVIDMIKDLSKAMYNHTVIEAMTEHPDKAEEMIEQKIL